MSGDMNLSVNGQSQVPPGFRFHPTEEELLHYYLRKKVAYEKIDLDVIRDIDLNKLEPWDIQEKCKIGSAPQNDWYFFSHKDKKYPTGTRTNRATAAGFWKATGRDKVIYSSLRRIGMRKTLVFYKGRAPHGQKSDWIMHEYRLDDNNHNNAASNPVGDSMLEEGWVVCRVFRKKNYQKTMDCPKSLSTGMDSRSTQMPNSGNDGVLDQILMYIGRSCKQENETINNINISDNSNNLRFITQSNSGVDGVHVVHDRFMHLPRLESPTFHSLANNTSSFDQDRSFNTSYHSIDEMLTESEPCTGEGPGSCDTTTVAHNPRSELNDWVALDRLVASQLNGHVETNKQLSCFTDPNVFFCISPDNDVQVSSLPSNRPAHASQVYSNESDLWSFNRPSSSSSSDPLSHLSV